MKNIDFLNELKIRASWGTVGNQSGIGLYDYIQLLGVNSNTTGPTNNGFPIIGSSPVVYAGPISNLVSLDRTWEKVETQNLGLDFSVLNSILSGSFDYFIKNNVNREVYIVVAHPRGIEREEAGFKRLFHGRIFIQYPV